MNYNDFLYLFPPRAQHKILPIELEEYEGQYIAQPKYNGSCAVVFTNGRSTYVFNRHKQPLTGVKIDLSHIHTGDGWLVVCGEYLNKNKKDEMNGDFNHQFIMWDILVYNNLYMIGYTLETRLLLLEELFPATRGLTVGEDGSMKGYEHILTTNIPNVHRAPAYTGYFEKLYNELVTTDLYEGIVLKKLQAPLALGMNEKNNEGWQVKIRKETKIYKF